MKRKLTAVSTLHYVRLVYRSILLILLLIEYFVFRFRAGPEITVSLQAAFPAGAQGHDHQGCQKVGHIGQHE